MSSDGTPETSLPLPHQRRASALGCRGRSPLPTAQRAAPGRSRYPKTAPPSRWHRARRSTRRPARPAWEPETPGGARRLKVRASPGAEAGDLRRRSDRDTRPRPPPGGLGGPRRPETGRPGAPQHRNRHREARNAGPCASTRRRDRQSRNRRRRPALPQWFRSKRTAAFAAGHTKTPKKTRGSTLLFSAPNPRRSSADPRGDTLSGHAGRSSACVAPPARGRGAVASASLQRYCSPHRPAAAAPAPFAIHWRAASAFFSISAELKATAADVLG